jgi:hypothetical protein
MFDKKAFVVFVCAAFVIPSIGAVEYHRAQSTPEKPKVDVSIALKVAGQPYNFSGKARCTHAPEASIYDTNAQQWMVEHKEDVRSVILTFWRPAAAPFRVPEK